MIDATDAKLAGLEQLRNTYGISPIVDRSSSIVQDPDTSHLRTAVSDRVQKQLDNAFRYHAPKPGQPERYQELRDAAKALAEKFASMCPDSREQSLALTNLEQAVMWANAAIARHE